MIKLNITILLFLISLKSFSCELTSPTRHTNPDSTEGGLVSSQAKVAPTAYIGYNAKVCDSAWVDGNAKVLDHAIVKGSAWVREFSTVKENAVITDNAVLWGNQGYPVVVGEEALVSGSSRVLAGTKIDGKARVLDNATLRSVTVGGNARICGGYFVVKETILDDYYCKDSILESRAEVTLVNYKEDFFNEITDELEFKTNLYDFDLNANAFIIYVNNEQVDPENVLVERKRVLVSNVILREGENTVYFSGRDEYGKLIDSRSFSFIAGSGTKEISFLSNGNPIATGLNVNAEFTYESYAYKASTSFQGGVLELVGVPDGMEGIKFKVSGVGDEGYFLEEYASLSDLPSSITLSNFPSFINNNGNLVTLSDWEISHPENVELGENKSGKEIHIHSEPNEVVAISKTFHLKKNQHGIHLDLKMLNPNKVLSANTKVEVIVTSETHQTFDSQTFTLGDLNSSESLNLSFLKKSKSDGLYSVVIKLFSDQEQTLSFFGVTITDVFVDFKPMNFYAEVKDGKAPLVDTYNVTSCKQQDFFLLEEKLFQIIKDEVTFFSAAQNTPMMPSFKTNRIFGTITIYGLRYNRVRDIKLIVEQDEKELFRLPLSPCAMERFNYLRGIPLDTVHLVGNDSLVHYLFEVDKEDLKKVNSIKEINNKKVAARVSMKLEVEIQHNNPKFKTIFSPEKKLKVFSTPNLSEDYIHNKNVSVEDYNTKSYKVLKTGGDKWIYPTYQKMFEDLMQTSKVDGKPLITVNDISKLNGGRFHGHKTTHDTGIDADLFFSGWSGERFDLTKYRKHEDWMSYLDKLEQFFIETGMFNHHIKDYYMTVEQKGVSLEVAKSYLESRFKNRCIGNRFITFTEKKNTGSLIRNVKDHYRHFHLRFNEPSDDTSTYDFLPLVMPPIDIGQLKFSVSEGQLQIRPLEEFENDFSDKFILWRIQNKPGFKDKDLQIGYGQWPEEALPSKMMSKTNSSFPLYIYIVLGKKGTGECSCYKVEVDAESNPDEIIIANNKQKDRRNCYED